MKRIVFILTLMFFIASCSSEPAIPQQPDFIKVSLEEPYSITRGETFELSVPEVEGADKYVWNLPEVLVAVGDTEGNKISVRGTVEGTITAGMISVVAVNSSGQSISRTFWKDIRITGLPPQPDYVTISVKGSLVVDKDEEFKFTAKEDDNATAWNWSVPENMKILSGQGTREIIVKVTQKSVMVPAESVKVAVDMGADLSQVYSFRWDIVVLPIDEYHTAKRYGDKVWMTVNLNYAGKEGNVGKTAPGDDSGSSYGRYYTWAEAMTGSASMENPYVANADGTDDMGADFVMNNGPDSYNIQVQGICPEGWHIPNAYDFYDLIAGVAEDYNLRKASIEDVRDSKEGIYLPPNRETAPMTAANMITYGFIASYLRGSAPASDGGLWKEHAAQRENGTMFYLDKASGKFQPDTYPMYYPITSQIGFNILPTGQYKADGTFSGIGTYSFHWTATNTSGKNYRFTLGNNTCNLSTSSEAKTSNSVRCVANYPPEEI